MIVKERADETYLQYFFSLSYFQSLDVIGAAVMHVREKPDGNPPALADPKLIGGKPTHSTSSIRSLRSMVEELDPYNIPGFRLGPTSGCRKRVMLIRRTDIYTMKSHSASTLQSSSRSSISTWRR